MIVMMSYFPESYKTLYNFGHSTKWMVTGQSGRSLPKLSSGRSSLPNCQKWMVFDQSERAFAKEDGNKESTLPRTVQFSSKDRSLSSTRAQSCLNNWFMPDGNLGSSCGNFWLIGSKLWWWFGTKLLLSSLLKISENSKLYLGHGLGHVCPPKSAYLWFSQMYK